MNVFRKSIDDLARDASAENMRRLVDAVTKSPVIDEDVAHLAVILGGSGRKSDFSEYGTTADVASSGGPASLTTLVCPLYLRAFGYCVPKIGVPGRPAGGIDVMAQISGFKFRLTLKELREIVALTGYAHGLAQGELAPLDASLFNYRQASGSLAVAELVIASLLAKKLALGITTVGLDVRVAPHGNLGSDWDVARTNARRFCRVSKLLGISSTCVLTDGVEPYQPFLGRGESLLAIYDLLEGNANEALTAHGNLCFRTAAATTKHRPEVRPSCSRLKACFAEHLCGHGSGYGSFESAVAKARSASRFDLEARSEGFVKIDLARLRSLLVDLQKSESGAGAFPDPCGIIFQVTRGTYVWPGDLLARVRTPAAKWSRLKDKFASAFSVTDRLSAGPYYEEVRDA